jgi:hypothetical protein
MNSHEAFMSRREVINCWGVGLNQNRPISTCRLPQYKYGLEKELDGLASECHEWRTLPKKKDTEIT